MNISSFKAFGNARKALIGLLFVGASCVSSQASAALVLFTLTGDVTASFTLDQSPTPTSVYPNNFLINNVAATLLGASDTVGLDFRRDDFDIDSQFTIITLQGSRPLFSGTYAAPTFNLGTYSFADTVASADGEQFTGNSNLSITSVNGAVPEPSTWMMMVAGFGLLGGAVRYGRKANAETQTASLA